MTMRYRNRREGKVFSGILLVVIGTIFLLGNLNFLEIRPLLSHWWPLLLIVFGIKHLIVWRGTGAWVGSLFWLTTGALFLANTLGYIDIGLSKVIWPLLLIWFGIAITFGPSCGRPSIRNGSEM